MANGDHLKFFLLLQVPTYFLYIKTNNDNLKKVSRIAAHSGSVKIGLYLMDHGLIGDHHKIALVNECINNTRACLEIMNHKSFARLLDLPLTFYNMTKKDGAIETSAFINTWDKQPIYHNLSRDPRIDKLLKLETLIGKIDTRPRKLFIDHVPDRMFWSFVEN
jgi:hypothetical protein